MNRKSILNLIYNKKLCDNLSSTRFPWGWKNKDLVEKQKKNY